jgi:hypothetical protein
MGKDWTEEYLSLQWTVNYNGSWNALQYTRGTESIIGMYLVKRKSALGTLRGATHMSDISRSNVSM